MGVPRLEHRGGTKTEQSFEKLFNISRLERNQIWSRIAFGANTELQQIERRHVAHRETPILIVPSI